MLCPLADHNRVGFVGVRVRRLEVRVRVRV
jgi:hypothetical protein